MFPPRQLTVIKAKAIKAGRRRRQRRDTMLYDRAEAIAIRFLNVFVHVFNIRVRYVYRNKKLLLLLLLLGAPGLATRGSWHRY